jgi:putative SOS response-associated peptidase YedK
MTRRDRTELAAMLGVTESELGGDYVPRFNLAPTQPYFILKTKYESRGPKARREPLWIHPTDDALLLFAGLFEAWQFQPGEWQTTFTILTTSANRLLEPIHNRMPVILDEAGAADWMNWRDLDPLSLKRLLVPASNDLLVVRPASPLVNSVKKEEPELLEDLSLYGQ